VPADERRRNLRPAAPQAPFASSSGTSHRGAARRGGLRFRCGA